MLYVAFLRGINVGGNTLMKMKDVKELFESLGFTEVQTILASGNIIFKAEKGSEESITRKIEAALKKKYKREVSVMLRTADELRRMEKSNPYKGIDMKPNIRFYVTFLYEPSRGVRIPEPDPTLRIVRIRDMDVFTVLELTENEATPAAMAMLTKVFGPKTTMRNWNTVLKIVQALSMQ